MRTLALLSGVFAVAAFSSVAFATNSNVSTPVGAAGVSAMTGVESNRLTTGSLAASASDQVDDPVGRALSCFHTCDDASLSDENRPTCVLRCVSDIEPDVPACEADCLDAFAHCWNPCASERPRTDEFTCRLNCEQAAEQCVGACEEVDASSQ